MNVKAVIKYIESQSSYSVEIINDDGEKMATIKCRKIYIGGREFSDRSAEIEIVRATIFRDNSIMFWQGLW